jgi:F-type H+-transporting ATPase subunit b
MKIYALLTVVSNADAPWWNVPGWEVWKIFNLLLFFGVLFLLLRRPLKESFNTRRESIRRDLMRAQEEREAALQKLAEVEARLSKLTTEVEQIRASASRDAQEERSRIAISTDREIEKIRTQARREIEDAGKIARVELRQFAAEQSIRLAEEAIRANLRTDDHQRLIREYVEDLGGHRA